MCAAWQSTRFVLKALSVQYTHSSITQSRYRKSHMKKKCLRSPTKYFECSTKVNNMCTHFTLYHGWQSSPSQFRCASPGGKIRCSCVNLNNLGGFQSHHHQLLLSFLIIIKIIIREPVKNVLADFAR